MLNPTVLTAGQEREQRGGYNVLGGSWNGKGTHMWRLKQEKPHLFEQKEKAYVQFLQEQSIERPPGFEPCSVEGWLFNKDKNVFLDLASRKCYWFDEAAKVHRPLHEGEALPIALAAGAAVAPGTPAVSSGGAGTAAVPTAAAAVRGSSSSNTGAVGGGGGASAASAASAAAVRQTAPKHVIISDLHLAARALKMDFGHLDRPAGALAVVGALPTGSAAALDVVARALPEKLLRRLAAFRGEWTDELFAAAVTGALGDVALGLGGLMPSAAVALIIGPRAVAAATPGAQAGVTVQSAKASQERSSTAFCSPGPDGATATLCRSLTEEDDTEMLLVALAVGEGCCGGFETLAPHLSTGRPRAASIRQLRRMRGEGVRGPLAVACARLSHRLEAGAAPGELAGVPPAAAGGSSSSSSSSSSGAAAGSAAATATAAHPQKRQKTEEAAGKVRVRQILLRHSSQGKAVGDTSRGRQAVRSQEEAEEQMLGVLDGLVAEGCASFPGVCKATSECQSALKGGEFAGDLGWLDRKSDDRQLQKDKTLKVQLPSGALKVAFELGVGELSDIVTSEQGVHLLQRTA